MPQASFPWLCASTNGRFIPSKLSGFGCGSVVHDVTAPNGSRRLNAWIKRRLIVNVEQAAEAAALEALELGLRPIPIKANRKEPLIQWRTLQDRAPTPVEVQAWFARWPGANVAILTGTPGGLDVIDLDVGHDAWPPDGRELPVGCVVSTPRGGRHFWFVHVDGARCSAGGLARGVDVRAGGGYALIPPSCVNGHPYEYAHGSLAEAQKTPAPPWLREGLLDGGGPKAKRPADPDARILAGRRNTTLMSMAGSMRRRGMAEQAISAALDQENRSRCDPPLPPEEVAAIARSAGRYAPADDGVPPGALCTDVGNAARLVAQSGNDLRWCGAWGKWLIWNGARWKADDSERITRFAKRAAESIFDEAKHADGEERQKVFAKWAVASQRRDRLVAMVALARCELAVSPDQFDADPWLLNVLNGTVNLRSGELQHHRREDFITKIAPVQFDATESCSLWECFLERIMDGNKVLMSYLQRTAGMCLTGDVREQCLFMCYGTGANGKSVLLDTLCSLLGDYATEAPPYLLTIRRTDEHPTEIADLCGRRLVVTSEIEEGRRLRVQLVKRLTGNQKMKGRYMRQDYFEFRRTHKLLVAMNNRPVIRESSRALWRRLRLIPFTVTIPEDEQDTMLLEKRRTDWPGILNWAIRGCLAWQRDGLQTPPEVETATRQYRAEQDPLTPFLEERCIFAPNAFVSRDDVFHAYQEWTTETHERYPLSRNDLYEHLRGQSGLCEGKKRVGGRTKRGFCGLGLVGREISEAG